MHFIALFALCTNVVLKTKSGREMCVKRKKLETNRSEFRTTGTQRLFQAMQSKIVGALILFVPLSGKKFILKGLKKLTSEKS